MSSACIVILSVLLTRHQSQNPGVQCDLKETLSSYEMDSGITLASFSQGMSWEQNTTQERH